MKKGFTLVEIMVVVGIVVTLIAISGSAFVFFKKGSSLDNNVEKVISVLKRELRQGDYGDGRD